MKWNRQQPENDSLFCHFRGSEVCRMMFIVGVAGTMSAGQAHRILAAMIASMQEPNFVVV
jgi:hypothetical protein